MAQIEQSDKGKKKKGAQKKKQIHVDFTPMVDMNMLLITFFMLCTTMIKPQTLSIALPSNEKPENTQQGTKAKESDAITMILDTEYDENGHVVMNDGKPVHRIYWYAGRPLVQYTRDGKVLNEYTVEDLDKDGDGIIDAEFAEFIANGETGKIQLESFIGNTGTEVNGIRRILHNRNEGVLNQIDSLKALYKDNKLVPGGTKDDNKAVFDEKAAQIRGAKKDTISGTYDYSWLTRPVIAIKPGPNASYENVVTALDEMAINQIGQYQLNTINGIDSLLINSFKHYNPSAVK